MGPCLESGYMPGRWHAQGRTDAASLQGAATYILVAPWLAHFGGSPPTLAGALPPECICGSRRTFSFYGCFSALRPHVSHLRPGLYCIVLFSRLCCLRVVCIKGALSASGFFGRFSHGKVHVLCRSARVVVLRPCRAALARRRPPPGSRSTAHRALPRSRSGWRRAAGL